MHMLPCPGDQKKAHHLGQLFWLGWSKLGLLLLGPSNNPLVPFIKGKCILWRVNTKIWNVFQSLVTFQQNGFSSPLFCKTVWAFLPTLLRVLLWHHNGRLGIRAATQGNWLQEFNISRAYFSTILKEGDVKYHKKSKGPNNLTTRLRGWRSATPNFVGTFSHLLGQQKLSWMIRAMSWGLRPLCFWGHPSVSCARKIQIQDAGQVPREGDAVGWHLREGDFQPILLPTQSVCHRENL